MNQYLFLKNKIQRRIEWEGKSYTFTRVVEDKYHREQGTKSITVEGIYHQTNSYQQKSSKDGSVTTTKPQPMILCLYNPSNSIDEINGEEISAENNRNPQLGDKVIIDGKTMLVTGVVDIQELHVALQISLEMET